jgi:hypothetical protein
MKMALRSSGSSLFKRFVTCSAILVPIVSGLPFSAWAGQYEAICGGIKCTVLISPSEISSPYGRIPSKRVTFWSNSGDSKTSVGTGVATTILFGGIGLLGFLAKNHQYNFTVNGYDAMGNSVSMQFEFKNDRPAKLLMQELVAVTGLGMGQTRTSEDIIKAEQSSQAGPGAIVNQSPGRLGSTLNSSRLPAASGDSRNCWTTYLNRNPAMKKWAESNPAQAAQNKKRFDDC